jgi:ribosomal protein S18 acetylase RimI-like enzyme
LLIERSDCGTEGEGDGKVKVGGASGKVGGREMKMKRVDEVEVRLATEGDFRQLERLELEFGEYTRGEVVGGTGVDWTMAFDDEAGATAHVVLVYFGGEYMWTLVAGEGRKIVGFISGGVERKDFAVYKTAGCVHNFFVTGARRRQGIGGRLWKAMMAEFERKGCDNLEISAYAQNESAIGFYRKMGFLDKSLKLVKLLGRKEGR